MVLVSHSFPASDDGPGDEWESERGSKKPDILDEFEQLLCFLDQEQKYMKRTSCRHANGSLNTV